LRLSASLPAILALLLLSSPAFLSVATAQPSQGNWVVTGQEVVKDRAVALNGNLTVVGGGILTLMNVSLSLNLQRDGQYGISVQKGGSLFVYNSTIAPSNPKYRFTFDVNGSNFVMKGSALSGVGRCSDTSGGNSGFASRNYPWGLRVWTNNSVLEDDKISGSAFGLILIGSRGTVTNNTISGNDVSAMTLFGSSDKIERNSFQQSATSFDDAMITGNNTQNDTIFGNSIVETKLTWSPDGRMDGIHIDSPQGIEIANNTIYVSNQALMLGSADLVVENNTLMFGENGISIGGGSSGVNSRIEGNSLQAMEINYESPGETGFSSGIMLSLADNSIIARNRLTGNLSQAIWLDHTANSSVLDNYVDSRLCGNPAVSQTSILLSSSTDNTVSGNELSGTFWGIVLYGSSDGNTISGNDVGAGVMGAPSAASMIVDGSSRNVIYGNDFHDFMSGGPYDDGKNYWYLQGEGNYWSHYTGTDNYGDGTGDSPYVRTAIPPSGSEPYSTQTAFPLVQAPIRTLSLAPLPILNSSLVYQGSVIKNQVLEFDYGSLPNNLTIINSTLILGLHGTVGFRGMGGTLTVRGSKIIGVGYGWALTHYSIDAVDSQLIGGMMQDLVVDGGVISIENSTIADSVGGYGITGGAPGMSLRLVNDTFSGLLWPVRFGGNGDHNMVIDNNTFVSSLGFALQIGGNNVSIIGNTIQEGLGIGIAFGGNDSMIRGNTISNCAVGLSIGGNNVNDVVYHNNFISDTSNAFGSAQWSYKDEGNYWGGYAGRDANFDGIGDTPYHSPQGVTDDYPFMKPNGWLTKFYLTLDTNLPESAAFQVNGTNFSVGQGGTATLRLGYAAGYSLTLPQTVKLTNGTILSFLTWRDGTTSAMRILKLSANSTLVATYVLEAPTAATTTTLELAFVCVVAVVLVVLSAILLRRRSR
jgi:parallel beta-helix repeat protein